MEIFLSINNGHNSRQIHGNVNFKRVSSDSYLKFLNRRNILIKEIP